MLMQYNIFPVDIKFPSTAAQANDTVLTIFLTMGFQTHFISFSVLALSPI